MRKHFVSATCEGELCRICCAPATHKLGEEVASDYPHETFKIGDADVVAGFHNLTAYVCCACFTMVVGGASGCSVGPTAVVPPRMIIASPASGDWTSMIVGGKVVIEGHSISIEQFLDHIGAEYDSVEISGEAGTHEDDEEAWFDYIRQFEGAL